MNLSRRRSLFLAAMLVIVLIITAFMLSGGGRPTYNVTVLLTFAVNIIIFIVNYILSINEHSYSFNMMFWLFNLFFMGLAPFMQYLYNEYAWNLVPSSKEIITTNIIVLLWSLFYIVGRRLNFSNKRKPDAERSCNKVTYIDQIALKLLVLVSLIMSLYLVIDIGIENIFYRDTANVSGNSVAQVLLIEHIFRNSILFTAILALVDAMKKKRITPYACIAASCLLISCFPTGISRNMMASFYGGLIIVLFGKKSDKRIISLFILGGLVLVFPAVNIFRSVTTINAGNFFDTITNSIKNTYLQGHYDAHQMFISIQRYTEVFGYSYGRQLIGAALFFVPRFLWPNKPIGTGHTVISKLQQNYFTNVSAPLVSESYINFGIIGVISVAILLGILIRKIDNKYWNGTNYLTTTKIIYPSAMFMFFFFLRGDMMSAWAYTFTQILIGAVICKFAIKTKEELMI